MKIISSFLVFGCIIFLSSQLFAQNAAGFLVTSQPGIYESAYSIAPKNFQVETRFEGVFGKNDFSNFTKFGVPSLFLRYGITSNFEARVRLTYQLNRKNFGSFALDQTGLVSPQVELKARLTPQDTRGPEFAMVFGCQIPGLSSSDFKINQPAPVLVLMGSQRLTDNNYLNLNLGMQWNGNNPVPSYNGALAFEQRLFGHAWGFIEAAASIIAGLNNPIVTHTYDLGMVIPFTPNTQLDWSLGGQFVQETAALYSALGFSFRINKSGNVKHQL